MDGELYVLRTDAETYVNVIDVYDASSPDYVLLERMKIHRNMPGFDTNVAVCAQFQCLVTANSEYKRVFVVERQGRETSWPLISAPSSISTSADCQIVIAFKDDSVIQVFSYDGKTGPAVHVHGLSIRELNAVVGLPNSQYVIAYETIDSQGHVSILNASGHVLRTDEAGLRSPDALAVSQAGYILVTDLGNNRVILLDPSLQYVRDLLTSHNGLESPYRISLDEPRGFLYVVNSASVSVFSLTN
jgi:hypothetical protein